MKLKLKHLFTGMILCFLILKASASNQQSFADTYTTQIIFPANYVVGDYVEFVGVTPVSVGASGYYQISISYTRGNIAAAATHVAAISHANPAVWREVGKINSNKYVSLYENFTVDCNTQYGNPRFRIRAVDTYGVTSEQLPINIKITSINFNNVFTPLNITGNDLTVNKFLPMTEEWDLYVGELASANGASVAIKALTNGNVGIGTTTPKEKLSVNGKIRAHEIKIETANWPDYVFEEGYDVGTLEKLESYIKANKHLPEVPSAKEVAANGVELGEMNKILLKKIEELTLYLIEKDKEIKDLKDLKNEVAELKKNIKNKRNE